MTDQELLEMAAAARKHAYIPYSGFAVGAALLGKSGRVYTGCNIENASYSVTVCAERTALLKAISEGEREFTDLAVVCDTPVPSSPCGVCRQFLTEFAPQCRVLMGNLKGDVIVKTAEELLPLYFSATDLNK
ncbi:MAG TPA: cytidine deaminase [Firmicutes bacterium]|jgi:cytidine deaminase|nr:cytidine deaminase [Bacillota bacterium]HAW69976.1 cytidine deaminase [Bacillota bacterium]HAZ22989.1 cytidine deaminase [Bacillota bacterium]HBE06916.1 cytidine deaminase [Bacillota bacterium]HBL49462.1 cytidine deaminase [Bacillota bacterium]